MIIRRKPTPGSESNARRSPLRVPILEGRCGALSSVISRVADLPCLLRLEFGGGLRIRPLHVGCVVRMHLSHRPRGFVCPKVGITVPTSVLLQCGPLPSRRAPCGKAPLASKCTADLHIAVRRRWLLHRRRRSGRSGLQLGIQHSVCALKCVAGCVGRLRERRPIAGSHGGLLAQAGDHRCGTTALPTMGLTMAAPCRVLGR
jgi:hypothetical protein